MFDLKVDNITIRFVMTLKFIMGNQILCFYHSSDFIDISNPKTMLEENL